MGVKRGNAAGWPRFPWQNRGRHRTGVLNLLHLKKEEKSASGGTQRGKKVSVSMQGVGSRTFVLCPALVRRDLGKALFDERREGELVAAFRKRS